MLRCLEFQMLHECGRDFDRYFTKQIAASYLPKRKLLCDALAAVGFKLSVPEGAYYIFTQYVVALGIVVSYKPALRSTLLVTLLVT